MDEISRLSQTLIITLVFILLGAISIEVKSEPRSGLTELPPSLATKLYTDPVSINLASTDYGHIVHKIPTAVLRPTSFDDVASLIISSYNSSKPFTVAARGGAHSLHGQAMAWGGVVVDMTSLPGHNIGNNRKGAIVSSVFHKPSGKYLHYADVGGDMFWIDVLLDTVEQGFTFVSWTDYLYITVGGTLSNAGISGQTFRFGPQISNVHELDVITGTGESLTCSRSNNSDLFYGVLGGLGQFGIITRARIALEPALKRVKWLRLLYDDFSVFTRDQERLISMNGRYTLDYVEGMLMMTQQGTLDSFFPSTAITNITSLIAKHDIIYCLEVAKYYDDFFQVNKELEYLLRGLEYVPGFRFEMDVSYVEFLNRIRPTELLLRSMGLWEVPHPWINMFVPKSRIADFNEGVFRNIVFKNNITTGLILFYPMNKNKWDDQMSVSIPNEDVFYLAAILQPTGFDNWQPIDEQNRQILLYCEDAGIEYKTYLHRYQTQEEWSRHFGSKWNTFRERKMRFDPKKILSPGQMIFDQ